MAAAIREGGLADIKAARIQAILRTVADDEADCGGGGGGSGSRGGGGGRRGGVGSAGDLSLEGLRELPTAQVKAFLSRFNGVGPKVIYLFASVYVR